MTSAALFNVWKSCGFKSSPYFQDVLQESSDTKSLRLFVGREEEQRQLLTTIGSSDSSRQAVAGFPGVGKTTLVQYIKAEAKKANYCVSDEFISITPEHSSDALLGQLIAGIYDSICACEPELKDREEMKNACHFVEVTRQRNISGGMQVMGIGGEISVSTEIHDPIVGLTLPARHIIKNLLKCVLDENKFEGVILHLNNIENLSESDTLKAADLLRSVRDTGLMVDGLHLIVVGPTSAVQDVINRHRQIESVFTPIMILEQLTLSDVHKLLENRYEALKIDSGQPFHRLIKNSIVEELYTIFCGDLRGILKSLDHGIKTLLLRNRNDTISLPFTLADFRPIIRELSQQESEKLERNLGDLNWERIVNWADKDLDSTQTQESLSRIWAISVGNVSIKIRELITAGAVEALPKRVERKIQYLLTGSARLATYKK
ncbi:MAG: ATP-binding protein [Synechococcus sp. SB0675_bin_6]|nr:ATP-binding protein [Synechococcus sp. SB0675_bin_6]